MNNLVVSAEKIAKEFDTTTVLLHSEIFSFRNAAVVVGGKSVLELVGEEWVQVENKPSFFLRRDELMSRLESIGVTGPAAELVVDKHARDRHLNRKEATLATAIKFLEQSGNLFSDALALIALDLGGIGGHRGIEGTATARILSGLGKSRWRASDGPVYRAAARELLNLIDEEITPDSFECHRVGGMPAVTWKNRGGVNYIHGINEFSDPLPLVHPLWFGWSRATAGRFLLHHLGTMTDEQVKFWTEVYNLCTEPAASPRWRLMKERGVCIRKEQRKLGGEDMFSSLIPDNDVSSIIEFLWYDDGPEADPKLDDKFNFDRALPKDKRVEGMSLSTILWRRELGDLPLGVYEKVFDEDAWEDADPRDDPEMTFLLSEETRESLREAGKLDQFISFTPCVDTTLEEERACAEAYADMLMEAPNVQA